MAAAAKYVPPHLRPGAKTVATALPLDPHRYKGPDACPDGEGDALIVSYQAAFLPDGTGSLERKCTRARNCFTGRLTDSKWYWDNKREFDEGHMYPIAVAAWYYSYLRGMIAGKAHDADNAWIECRTKYDNVFERPFSGVPGLEQALDIPRGEIPLFSYAGIAAGRAPTYLENLLPVPSWYRLAAEAARTTVANDWMFSRTGRTITSTPAPETFKTGEDWAAARLAAKKASAPSPAPASAAPSSIRPSFSHERRRRRVAATRRRMRTTTRRRQRTSRKRHTRKRN